MSTALVVFVLVLLLPLFLGSWRVSLVGLASQGDAPDPCKIS